MKKENVKRLLTEMIEREFDIFEVEDVIYYFERYLFSIRESKRESESEEYRKFWASTIDGYREWLLEAMEKYSLDFTLEEIEEPF